MRRVMVWVIGCGVMGFVGVAGAQVGGGTAAATRPAATRRVEAPRTPESAVTPAPHGANWSKRHDEFMKRKEEGPIGLLFVGDSITDFWPRRGAETWKKFEAYQPAD